MANDRLPQEHDGPERSNAALAADASLLRAVVDNLPDYIYVKDTQSRFVLNNRAHLRVLGAQSQEEVAGKTDYDIFPAELAHLYAADEREVLRTGEALSEREERAVDPEGEEQWLLTTKTPLRGADGRVVGLVGISRNITARKRVEEALKLRDAALQEAHQELERVLDTMGDGVMVLDANHRLVRANRRMCELLQYAEAELLGKGPEFWTHPDHLTISGDELAKRRHGERTTYETKCLRRDGSSFPALATGVAIFDEGGAYQGAVGCVADITSLKHAEGQLRETMAELARSNAELEQFACVASHDLQEPLRNMASFAELLAKRYQGQLDEKADRFIDYITDGAARMRELIQGLLAYSRVGTKGQELAPVALGECFEQALANLETALEDCQAVVTCDPLPTVNADPLQMTQLFQNLLGNALKFRGEETPRIHTSAERRGASHRLCVADNGIGIEPEFAERIFILYQRLHTRQEYPGTGLGLALCRKIVERHGGRIWVESGSGTGATFVLTIPVLESAEPAGDAGGPAADSEKRPDPTCLRQKGEVS